MQLRTYFLRRVSELGGPFRDIEACASLLMGEGNAVLQCERNSSTELAPQWPGVGGPWDRAWPYGFSHRRTHLAHFQVAFLRRALALGLWPISGRLLGAACGVGSQMTANLGVDR